MMAATAPASCTTATLLPKVISPRSIRAILPSRPSAGISLRLGQAHQRQRRRRLAADGTGQDVGIQAARFEAGKAKAGKVKAGKVKAGKVEAGRGRVPGKFLDFGAVSQSLQASHQELGSRVPQIGAAAPDPQVLRQSSDISLR